MSDLTTNATWWAMMLARDVETCCALLRGEPVDPALVHEQWVEYAEHFQLVRLDFAAIDLLHSRVQLIELLRETAA